MAALDSFRRLVLLEVPGAPVPLVDNAIAAGAREFAAKTSLLTSTVEFPTVAAQSEYDLTVPAGHEPAAILEASAEGGLLPPVRQGLSLSRLNEQTGRPGSYELNLGNKRMVIHPVPDGAYVIAARVAYQPALDATQVDDALVQHQKAIAAFAKYELMSMFGQPWSNPAGAAANFGRFVEDVAKVRIEQERGGTALSLRARPRRFG
jgi:hypothetical protein